MKIYTSLYDILDVVLSLTRGRQNVDINVLLGKISCLVNE